MKIWDIRQTKKPINVVYNLPSYLPGPKVCLSPDEKFIVTGTSVGKSPDERVGYLQFFDSVSLEKKAHICIGEEGVTDVLWHPTLNQILLGKRGN
jgi:WD repeat-containing protein 70